jgi:hypothetical protein
MGASDLKDERLIDEFWNHCAPIDTEHELRTEAWAPAGSANDEHLAAVIEDFRRWVNEVLSSTDDMRT